MFGHLQLFHFQIVMVSDLKTLKPSSFIILTAFIAVKRLLKRPIIFGLAPCSPLPLVPLHCHYLHTPTTPPSLHHCRSARPQGSSPSSHFHDHDDDNQGLMKYFLGRPCLRVESDERYSFVCPKTMVNSSDYQR